ncbi:hypothetical protein KEM54_001120 [Ascosphaera aggregata]|nr:hypothetical protein KEM54_001120 [Ascosphaera aggregata]
MVAEVTLALDNVTSEVSDRAEKSITSLSATGSSLAPIPLMWIGREQSDLDDHAVYLPSVLAYEGTSEGRVSPALRAAQNTFKMAMPPKVYQFLVSVFAAMGSFLYGYDLGVVAEVIASEDFLTKFEPNSDDTGLVVSMFTTGAFCGAAFAGPLGDYLGRRIVILTGALVFCVGGAVQTAADNIQYLWGGRFVAGLG